MFCKYCGKELPTDAKFCPVCGKLTDAPAAQSGPAAAQTQVPPQPTPVYAPQATEDTEERERMANGILTFGILGLAFAWFGISFLLGIIFSAIGMARASRYRSTYGQPSGKAAIGKGLSIGGLVLSIAMAAIFLFVFVIAFIGILGGGMYA